MTAKTPGFFSIRLIRYLLFLTGSLFLLPIYLSAQKVHTTYLWHMDQPVYWPDYSKDKPESKQFVEESQRLKQNGANIYSGSSVAHPTNNLEEIFSKADRVNAYQSVPRNAVNSIRDVTNTGAQLSISGGLMDNVKSLGDKNQWGYSSAWYSGYKEAYGWKTSGGFPRLDIINFTYDHALSPLVSERTLVKEIKAHQYSAFKYYGSTSKGYWPAECAFSERIIKALVSCGIEWSVVPNSHLARTLFDYVHPFNINGNVEAPNKADIVSATGTNWYDATIDGRGSRLAAPYCYQAHKAQYVDPSTGVAYTIDVVPMCNYMSYVDGYSGENVGDVATHVEPYSNTTQPSIVLLAHDGDNAWGGGSSYYNEAVTSFTHAASGAGYEPTTIQQFLTNHPVPSGDIVHVEDGAWVNAESDWGHPQFINWLWPLYSKTTWRFNPAGWTEDARNWAVITATENYVTMAEDLEGNNLRIQYVTEGGTSATNAEKAWHFYMGGLNSGFMYYGKSEDMEVKESLTGNIAINYAQKVIAANAGTDNTPPSVFIPQRFPYNPGSTGFGPTTSYTKVNYPGDFDIWTFAYDVSGLTSVTLKYRTDADGKVTTENKVYANGSGISGWKDVSMNRQPMTADPTTDSELNFFILPQAKADLCYASITGLKDTLVDYYVEAVDTKGNIFRTPIQHVYVGGSDGGSGGSTSPNISWTPVTPDASNTITISCKNATQASKLHWGVNGINGAWIIPVAAYQPAGTTVLSGSVETPFTKADTTWQVVLGPFNNPSQAVTSINFVINHGSNVWDNNGGSNYLISVAPVATNNPVGQNISKTLNEKATYTFSVTDFGFSSPVGNNFKAIKILSLPAAGTLLSGGNAIEVNQIINDVTQLTYTAGTLNSSFTYQMIDSGDLISDATYTANFIVKSSTTTAISVSFKKPSDWGTNDVYLWAWNSGGNLFTAWPGIAMADNGNGWYSYTFDASVTTVNVIFSKKGNPQTVDITGVTQTSCYQQSGLSGSKLTVSTIDCSTTEIRDPEGMLRPLIYPQPAGDRFVVELPNISDNGEYELTIFDLNGKPVLNQQFKGNFKIVNRNNIPAGFYILQISSLKVGSLFSTKLSLR